MAEAKPKTALNAQAAEAEAALPYRVELRDPATGEVRDLLATGRSAALGFAAYYAALREHLGQHITLTREGQVVAASQPPQG